MCFPSGPSQEEKQAAADQRVAAEQAKRSEVEKRAEGKREDISEALSARTQQRGMRGGRGRRSLFRSGGAGFLGRFNS